MTVAVAGTRILPLLGIRNVLSDIQTEASMLKTFQVITNLLLSEYSFS